MAAAFDSDAARASTLRISADALDLARASADELTLEGVDLQLRAGECVLLEGATGAGKSTLLRALAGLGGVERRSGSIETQGSIALLLQHIETQLLCPVVGEEVGLGLRSQPLPEADKGLRIRSALRAVDLDGYQDHEVDRLSAGQKQRVVLAALLALEPRTLLLDEPFAALDAPSRRALVDVLTRLKRNGTALLIAEHAPRELLAIVDRRLCIESKGLRTHSHRPTNSGTRRAAETRVIGTAQPPAAPVLEHVPSRASGSAPASAPVPVPAPAPERLEDLQPGERVLVTGPNGSGKSLRLRALAQQPSQRGHVALVLQEPRRSLFARSVREEVAFAIDRLQSRLENQRDQRVDVLLDRFELLPFANRSPLRLSFGQQHRLAIAAALSAQPAFVLLDEPFSGLDPVARQKLLQILDREQAETGCVYVIASHDREPLADWCSRVTALAGRGL